MSWGQIPPAPPIEHRRVARLSTMFFVFSLPLILLLILVPNELRDVLKSEKSGATSTAAYDIPEEPPEHCPRLVSSYSSPPSVHWTTSLRNPAGRSIDPDSHRIHRRHCTHSCK